MSQKIEDQKYIEAQPDVSVSATMFHGPVKGYVSTSTGNGPTIGYSHNTHIYNVSLGAIPPPESYCNRKHFAFVVSYALSESEHIY
jgi:hypothetical protein